MCSMLVSNSFHTVQYAYIKQVPLCAVCLYPTVSTLYSMPILNRFHYVQYACIQQFPHCPERQDHIHEEFYALYACRLPLTRLFLVQ
jgi:hypothetical protein